MRGIRDVAAQDPESSDLKAAIDRFALHFRPVRPLSDWFFASGAYPLVIRTDGALYLCGPAEVRRARTSSQARYTVDGLGKIVGATIDNVSFGSLRPAEKALQLLDAVHATRSVDDSVLPTPDSKVESSRDQLGSPHQTLRQLQQLLADGLISDAEYQLKRKDVLDRI